MSDSASPVRKKILFTALYFSEGAPIGFLWWALPTRLKSEGIPLREITALTAVLVIPWTFKFLWAPLVDSLQSPRWTLRHWIVTCQLLMAITLVPLLWLDLKSDFETLRWLLLLHALFAATQDVAIDALCITLTQPSERGEFNGWMQAGMLAGRSLLGGGALILFARFGNESVITALLVATTFSMTLLFVIPEARLEIVSAGLGSLRDSFRGMARSLKSAFAHRRMWFGVAFALTGGAAFEALGALQGPTLVSLGFSEETVGWIFAVPYVIAMAAGSIAGGYLADRFGHRRFVVAALMGFVLLVGAAGGVLEWRPSAVALAVCCCLGGFAIGLFTAASYAMFMDLTDPKIAGTQFSAFMGATNGCESWAAKSVGLLAAPLGTGRALWVMCAVSIAALPFLIGCRPARADSKNLPVTD